MHAIEIDNKKAGRMRDFFQSIWGKILGCFIAGVLAILPLVITVAIVGWVVSFAQRFVGPGTAIGDALSRVGLRYSQNSVLAYLIGWLLVLAVIFALGVLLQLGMQRLFSGLTNTLIKRIPILGSIYGTTEQFVGLLDKKKSAELAGMSPVFCWFGEKTGAGLLALLVSPKKYRINEREYQVVIVPTAPVPVGGGLFFVPTENVQPANMSIDGLMSIYVSMGATTGQFIKDQDAAPNTD